MSDISPTFVRRWSDTFISPLGHLLNVTPIESVETDPIIWRCISYKPISAGMGGIMQQVMYDDMVSTERIGLYFSRLLERGIEKVTIPRGSYDSAYRFDISGDVLGTQITTDCFGAQVAIHLRGVRRAGDGFYADRSHAIADVDIATNARSFYLAL